MFILSINSVYHKSAAALLKDGVLLATAEEERFNRIKHGNQARSDNPHELPLRSIAYVLDHAGISLADVVDRDDTAPEDIELGGQRPVRPPMRIEVHQRACMSGDRVRENPGGVSDPDLDIGQMRGASSRNRGVTGVDLDAHNAQFGVVPTENSSVSPTKEPVSTMTSTSKWRTMWST